MHRRHFSGVRPISCAALSILALMTCLEPTRAQIVGYGVTANGALFRFDPDAPAVATPIGNLGIVPEAIDFRPGTNTLYAVDVGATTTTLYTVSTTTAAITAVGGGFPSAVAGSYDLTAGNRFGFDFNPTTLQPNGSMRIRLIASNTRDNLRLNSDTGLVENVDTKLAIAPGGAAPFADAAAYTNSAAATSGGTTVLYDMDSRNDKLYTQSPPNDGTLNEVGAFGVTVDAQVGIAFDILSTDPNDSTLGDERGFAAFTRAATSNGDYLLYDVNLATGLTTNGRLVGGGLDFTGGLAVTTPEPASAVVLASLMVVGSARSARRRRQS